MTDAIVELEIKVAHQDATLNELSDVVAQQQQQIDRLLKEVQRLHDRLEEHVESIRTPSEEAPPPHYYWRLFAATDTGPVTGPITGLGNGPRNWEDPGRGSAFDPDYLRDLKDPT